MEITCFDTDTLNYDVIKFPTLLNEESLTITDTIIENYKDLGDDER